MREITATSLEYQAMGLFFGFMKIFFRKRVAAVVLSVIFLYTFYRMILSDRDASLIVTQINIDNKVKTNQFQDIEIGDNRNKISLNFQSKRQNSKKDNTNRFVQITND